MRLPECFVLLRSHRSAKALSRRQQSRDCQCSCAPSLTLRAPQRMVRRSRPRTLNRGREYVEVFPVSNQA
jgi:hypothetical protein